MKRTAIACVVLSLMLLAGAGPAAAQGGAILLSSSGDPAAFDCDFTESLFAINSVYVIHTLRSTAYGAQFRVVDDWTPFGSAVQAGVWYPDLYVQLGDIYTGVAVSYTTCKPLPQVVARMDFLVIAATPPCTFRLWVSYDLNDIYSDPVTWDCDLNAVPAIGGSILINGTFDCPCFVGTEQSTWGKLKSLYR